MFIDCPLAQVRAGIVNKPEYYLLSSARNYADMEGLLEIVRLTRPINM